MLHGQNPQNPQKERGGGGFWGFGGFWEQHVRRKFVSHNALTTPDRRRNYPWHEWGGDTAHVGEPIV